MGEGESNGRFPETGAQPPLGSLAQGRGLTVATHDFDPRPRSPEHTRCGSCVPLWARCGSPCRTSTRWCSTTCTRRSRSCLWSRWPVSAPPAQVSPVLSAALGSGPKVGRSWWKQISDPTWHSTCQTLVSEFLGLGLSGMYCLSRFFHSGRNSRRALYFYLISPWSLLF